MTAKARKQVEKHVAKARDWVALGEGAEAIRTLAKAIRLLPKGNRSRLWLQLALWECRFGSLDEAEILLEFWELK